jgi:GNAT superfamily N-acetyltransferase
MPITVRAARPVDRGFIVALVPRLWAFGPPPLRPTDAMGRAERGALERALDAPPEGSALLVAERDGADPVGVVYLETATDYFTGERHGHVGILIVSEAGEGHGVGRALLEAADAWGAERGYRFLTLNVFGGNARARLLYERAGYAVDTVRYAKVLSRGGRGAPEP